MRRLIFAGILLALTGLGAGATAKGLVCSLTGKHIDQCCCEEKDGKLYCPLADKTVENCCCSDSK